jgi:hypothetical protein
MKWRSVMIEGFLNHAWSSGMWFFLVCFAISGLISIIGGVYARNLPQDIKKLQTQKIGFISLIPILCGFIFSGPYISSWTRLYDHQLNVESLETTREIKAFESIQTRQIDDLKLEVVRLRDDLNQMNDMFRFFVQISMTMGIVTCVTFYRLRNKQINEIILDGKRGEKTLNL